jgi:hypothetical protein
MQPGLAPEGVVLASVASALINLPILYRSVDHPALLRRLSRSPVILATICPALLRFALLFTVAGQKFSRAVLDASRNRACTFGSDDAGHLLYGRFEVTQNAQGTALVVEVIAPQRLRFTRQGRPEKKNRKKEQSRSCVEKRIRGA